MSSVCERVSRRLRATYVLYVSHDGRGCIFSNSEHHSGFKIRKIPIKSDLREHHANLVMHRYGNLPISRDGFTGGGGAPPLALVRSGGGAIFHDKQKIIRDKMRYSNLSKSMMISELSNIVVKQDFAVVKQVDGWVAHMADTTRHQSWQSTPPPPTPTRSCWIYPCRYRIWISMYHYVSLQRE